MPARKTGLFLSGQMPQARLSGRRVHMRRRAPCSPAPLRHFCDVFAIQAFLLDFYSYLCHRKKAVELTAMSRKEFPCHPTVPSLPVSRYLSRHADRLPCVHLPAGSTSPARRSPCPVPAFSCRLSPSTAPSVTGSSSGRAVMSCILPARPSPSWAGRP